MPGSAERLARLPGTPVRIDTRIPRPEFDLRLVAGLRELLAMGGRIFTRIHPHYPHHPRNLLMDER